ncbi:MAG: hypothetical protein SFU83_15510 [Meiothermus sp.]|nr:hypothetical protein [Meiothermus sp.]
MLSFWARLGLPLIFQVDDLKRRINQTDIDINRAVEVLWEAGILGVTAEPQNLEARQHLQSLFIKDNQRTYRNTQQEPLERWCWFEYNYDGDALQILERVRDVSNTNCGLVLHSKGFEFFAPRNIELRTPLGA